jgi:hypothetical protein
VTAAMQLGVLLLSGQDEEDLRWYFNEARGALGLKSLQGNFERQMIEGLSFGGHNGDHFSDFTAEHVARERRIRLALMHAGARMERALWFQYGPEQPEETVELFGRLGPLAVELPEVAAMHVGRRTRRELADWITQAALRARYGEPTATDLDLAAAVGDGLTALLVEAHGAYLQGLRATRRRAKWTR